MVLSTQVTKIYHQVLAVIAFAFTVGAAQAQTDLSIKKEFQPGGSESVLIDNSACAPLNSFSVRLRADLGQDFVKPVGWTSSTVSVSANIAVGGAGAITLVSPVSLTLTSSNPEKWYVATFQANNQTAPWVLGNGSNLTVSATASAVSTSGTAPPGGIRIIIECVPEYKANFNGTSYLTAPNAPTPVSGSSATSFEYTFNWNSSCARIPSYQLRVLYSSSRLLSVSPAIWQEKALLIDTGSPQTNYTLTLTEGIGYYYWQVRGIGNQPGGSTDLTNVGAWADGQAIEVTAVPHADLNWIYNRTFSEGGRVSEKLTFANGLQQIRQTQTRLAAVGLNSQATPLVGQQIIATQTIQDYAGRNAVQSLPIPILTTVAGNPLAGPTVLGYKPNLLKKSGGTASYEAADFDSDVAPASQPNTSTFNQPLGAVEQGYYSNIVVGSGANSNDRVANAGGYPFTRTRFASDGRVREQSGVGLAMRLQPEAAAATTHTSRTYYAAVAPQELIRLFGNEAPDAKATYKVLTIDPNNTTSVSYQTKQGQTIATALSSAGSSASNPTEPLPSATVPAPGDTITEDLAGPAAVVGKTLFITEPTTSITINYTLTPAVLQNECLSYCASCDYKVRLTINKVNDPTFAATVPAPEVLIPSQAVCNPIAKGLTAAWTVTLTMGEYRIEREILPADPVAATPVTIPPAPAVPTISTRLSEIQNSITDKFKSEPWSEINRLLSEAKVDELYSYLLNKGYKVEDVGGEAYIKIPVNGSVSTCQSFLNFPYLPEYCHPSCKIGDVGPFAELLTDRIKQINELHNTTFDIKDVLGKYSPDDFIKMLLNMQQYGNDHPELLFSSEHPDFPLRYSCQDLMACMNAQLTMLETNLTVTGNAPSGYTYEFVKEFLDCTGVDMVEPVDGQIDIAQAFKQFSYDSKDPNDKQCLVAAFACQHEINDPQGVVHIDFDNQVKPELDQFAKYTRECRARAYNCLTNRAPIATGTTFNGQDEAEKAGREMERTCRSTCNDRRGDFRASVIDGFHRKGLSVVGDAYYVSVATGSVVFTEAIKDQSDPNLVESCQVDFLVQALVEQCQKDCQVSVKDDGSGAFTVGTPEEIVKIRKVMFNAYDLEITKSGESCQVDFEKIVPKGNQLFQAELTSCAQDIISYIGALARGVPALMADPNRTRSCNVPVGTVGAYNSENIFSVIGPLRKQCTQTDPACVVEPDRINHWITVIDARVSGDKNLAFNEATDYSLIWSRNGVWCSPDGDDVPGVSKGLTSTCGETHNPYQDPPNYYQLYFVDENGNAIEKKDIRDVSAIFLDEPSSGISLAQGLSPGPNSTNLFTPEGVKVRLTLASGAWTVATMVALVYRQRTEARITGTPTYTMLRRLENYLQWKTVESCSLANNLYEVCLKWHDELETTTAGEGTPVFTGEPAPCNQVLARQLQQRFSMTVGKWQQDQLADITQQYQNKCQALAGAQEHFTVTYSLGYHHFTLYYYDRGGNLLRTVPPKGVSILADNAFLSAPTPTAPAPNFKPRSQWGRPAHTLVTMYSYNSLHQLVSQETPDGGVSQFFYNRKGQPRFSRNARQQHLMSYSYTKYDALGRTVEVGESQQDFDTSVRGGSFVPVLAQIEDVGFPSKDRLQVTTTVYSTPAKITYSTGSLVGSAYADAVQRHLINRVSYSLLDADGDPNTKQDNSSTYYSYDSHGNVEWLVQKQYGLGNKYLRYEYDLVSNKVLRVYYQEGQEDQFYHRYSYDGDNRLTQVSTSSNGVIWDQDARYSYYAHGPLKRVELGEDHVQGIDYTYTLQGWLKAINHPTTDPGNDGIGTVPTSTAKDVFAMSLGYFTDDYATTPASWTATGYLQPTASQGLYNGNIATWTSWGDNAVNGMPVPPQAATVTGETYHYDELNRLLSTRTSQLASGNFAASTDYATDYTYDANGNLLTLKRKTGAAATTTGNVLDDLQYSYAKAGTNQLTKVDDAVSASVTTGFDDIKPFAGATEFSYDEIGNLIADAGNNVTNIDWTVYGKIASVTKGNGTVTSFRYDPAGNRILKTLSTNNGAQVQRTYYVRDAQGNIMATYNQMVDQQTIGAVTLREHSIYGSSRLGVHTPAGSAALGAGYYARTVGEKQYELTDHLGNVRAVVSDAKLPNTGGTYKASLASYYNYYAFGMLKPDNNIASTGTGAGAYRYGFNGKERDNNGELGLTSYDYGFRIYNPGLGKFLSVDPLTTSYPMLTPYQFASNTPIQAIDLDGLEAVYITTDQFRSFTVPKLKQSEWYNIDGRTEQSSFGSAAMNNLMTLNNKAYTRIMERAEFYEWFQGASEAKGFKTRWAGAASKVATAVGLVAGELPDHADMGTAPITDFLGYSNDAIRAFSYAGNEMIFNDALPKLRAIYTGPVREGELAETTDKIMLAQEQNLVQRLYKAQSESTIRLLSDGAKQKSWFVRNIAPVPVGPFPESFNLMSVRDRWVYGMHGMNYGWVLPATMPSPATPIPDAKKK